MDEIPEGWRANPSIVIPIVVVASFMMMFLVSYPFFLDGIELHLTAAFTLLLFVPILLHLLKVRRTTMGGINREFRLPDYEEVKYLKRYGRLRKDLLADPMDLVSEDKSYWFFGMGEKQFYSFGKGKSLDLLIFNARDSFSVVFILSEDARELMAQVERFCSSKGWHPDLVRKQL